MTAHERARNHGDSANRGRQRGQERKKKLLKTLGGEIHQTRPSRFVSLLKLRTGQDATDFMNSLADAKAWETPSAGRDGQDGHSPNLAEFASS